MGWMKVSNSEKEKEELLLLLWLRFDQQKDDIRQLQYSTVRIYCSCTYNIYNIIRDDVSSDRGK